jgi:hypothetical protein
VINVAKSKAKKLRERLVREGNRNPEASRSPFAFTDMRIRKTKTKKDLLYRNKHKNHSPYEEKNGSFFILVTTFYSRSSMFMLKIHQRNRIKILDKIQATIGFL